ncbi:hypothetical protein Q8A67_007250 [Cirrhinus molitorella]|uniref:Uncharacterized protein n=1 Tax=Cirrhinus molitorella TaxID=172907 RepID=A0AA88Q6K0_9TELE|nr:hypothetical protein Q8A67_007250 [Cirrhinus molitorella]
MQARDNGVTSLIHYIPRRDYAAIRGGKHARHINYHLQFFVRDSVHLWRKIKGPLVCSLTRHWQHWMMECGWMTLSWTFSREFTGDS